MDAFFADKEVGSIVISNPDNLTGQGIKIADVEKILDWCGKEISDSLWMRVLWICR